MKNKEFRAAFDPVCASEEVKRKVLNMTGEEKPAARWNGKTIALRLGSLAAAVAVLLTVLFWPRETEDGFVTAPGILKVYGYDINTGTSIDDMEMRELEEFVTSVGFWSPVMSSMRGLPLKFQVEDDTLEGVDITFHIRVNGGEFHGDPFLDKYKENPEDLFGTSESTFLGDDFVIENGETIDWQIITRDWLAVIETDGGVFVEAVIWGDGYVLGYVVIKIAEVPDSSFYAATKLKAEYYQKMDGQYQSITEEEVRQEIENCKAEALKN